MHTKSIDTAKCMTEMGLDYCCRMVRTPSNYQLFKKQMEHSKKQSDKVNVIVEFEG